MLYIFIWHDLSKMNGVYLNKKKYKKVQIQKTVLLVAFKKNASFLIDKNNKCCKVLSEYLYKLSSKYYSIENILVNVQ